MRNFLLLSSVLFSLQSFSQAVNHFGDPFAEWYVAHVYPHGSPGNPSFVETRTTYYTFDGDSIINNQLWHKIYSAWDTNLSLASQYRGLIHSSDNIVLYKDPNGSLDTLYNFNLEVGDSVFFDLLLFPQYIQIIEIDSILLNELYFKRFIFEEPSGPFVFDVLNEVWIQGIGSHHGPLFPNQPRTFSTEIPDKLDLTCSFSGGFQYWQHSSYDECLTNIILDIDEIKFPEVKVYPNPFRNILNIEIIDPNEEIHFEVMNISGMVLCSGFLGRNRIKTTVKLDHGIYFVRLADNSTTRTIKAISIY